MKRVSLAVAITLACWGCEGRDPTEQALGEAFASGELTRAEQLLAELRQQAGEGEDPLDRCHVEGKFYETDCWTYLHMAASIGSVELTAWLLEQGAEPDTRANEDGRTPLHIAVQAGHVETVSALLAGGADPSLKALGEGGVYRSAFDFAHEVEDPDARAVLLEMFEPATE